MELDRVKGDGLQDRDTTLNGALVSILDVASNGVKIARLVFHQSMRKEGTIPRR